MICVSFDGSEFGIEVVVLIFIARLRAEILGEGRGGENSRRYSVFLTVGPLGGSREHSRAASEREGSSD